ncbi:hypothetical protein, partial [Salmonella enterica]|uniref:hypothetical protein n=1 Tax=Salmonella enterica TaxID=28901 RepID=UPI003D2A3BE7
RVYIDNLFQEGRLSPTDVVERSRVGEPWMLVGVAASDRADESDRFCRLLDRLAAEVPDPDANHTAWIDYTKIWAEYAALRWSIGNGSTDRRT